MAVLLYDTSGAQDVCINEFLVQNGYCQPAGLGYAFHNVLNCSSVFKINEAGVSDKKPEKFGYCMT